MEHIEDIPNSTLKISDSKAAIFETFDRLRKWREAQVQQFQNMQLLESKKILQQSQENQKHFDELIEHNKNKSPELSSPLNFSSVSVGREESDSSISLQNSSITGHLLRCFGDSAPSTPSINGGMGDFDYVKPIVVTNTGKEQSLNDFLHLKRQEKEHMVKDDVKTSHLEKPKRPFLKKGAGLLRYKPKSAKNHEIVRPKKVSVPQRKPPCHRPQKTLKLKPFVSKNEEFSKPMKHVQFYEINLQDPEKQPPSVTSCASVRENTEGRISLSLDDDKNVRDDCISKAGESQKNPECYSNENLESKELAEFEILENCAQNSSFNSDSSIVQRVLRGEPVQPLKPIPCEVAVNNLNTFDGFLHDREVNMTCGQTPDLYRKTDFNKCLEEVQTRKQQLQQMILDINPKIASLEMEIKSDRYCQENIKSNERCCTPKENISSQNKILNPASEKDFSEEYLNEIFDPTKTDSCSLTSASAYDCCDIENAPDEDCCEAGSICFRSETISEDENLKKEASPASIEKSKIREKLIELEKEIEIYQEQNAKLLIIRKEREEIVKKLKKEQDEFQKYKEEEKRKLEAEIENERKQIRRQKETFLRFQKLRQDNPSRKEREELSALRLEVEKLQEELKRQKIKNNNDAKRLKSLLVAAEKDRDTFKLENIRLEEQCQDLLATLKARNRKWKNEMLKRTDTGEKDTHKNSAETDLKTAVDDDVPTKDTEEKLVFQKTENDSSKPKVRFNLKPECESASENLPCNGFNSDIVHLKQDEPNFHNDDDNSTEDSEAKISESGTDESEFKEIDHGDKIERIYISGEREIIFPSGTRKVVSADGNSMKFFFYNGDVKEIFPDKSEIYRYLNGAIETRSPDGLELTDFPNGQIQKRYPDGLKEIKFPDGTIHYMYVDGSEEIHAADGTTVTIGTDGTEIVEFVNGQREIRTSTFKRREFPDGSVKIIYDSGRQETRYSNGRIRIKDKDGKLIVDTKYLGSHKVQTMPT